MNFKNKISADEAIKFEKSHFINTGNGENNVTKKQRLIMLAPESPLHCKDDRDGIYDESTYDSFHNFETGEY